MDECQLEEVKMAHNQTETLVERRVTYTLEVQSKLVVENVPARVHL